MNKITVLAVVISCVFLFDRNSFAESDLMAMSLEDLMNVEVYSASKKSEKISDTAAAITVITPDDIRRSGATSIAELLRMVPGARVQKVNSHAWDLSIRGFNGSVYANKLLVLIDGRSVYTPLYGGVLWVLQDVVLEDVERIEVIRGPGGALWGANAVNGVVNVITKKAADTQGTLLSVGAGTEERGFTTARYGGKSGDWMYRTYAKYFNKDSGFQTNEANLDDWDMAKTGIRAEKGKLTIQSEYFSGNAEQRSMLTSFTPPYTQIFKETARTQGGHLLSTYVDDDWFLKMYWDVTHIETAPLGERRDQIELEYTRQVPLTARQEINWGAGYRLQLEDMNNTLTNTITEAKNTDQVFSLFVQDEIEAIEDEKLKLIVGTKLEHNADTGIEVQPNVRGLYHINDKNQVWAAASRAVRTPSRLDISGRVTNQLTALPVYRRFLGKEGINSEHMSAVEMGYRTQPTKNMMFDLAVFSNYYDQLVAFDYAQFFFTTDNGFFIQNIPTANSMKGDVHGVELTGDIQLREWWKLKAYYSYIKMSLQMEPGFTNIGLPEVLNAATPVHTGYMQSSFDLPHGFELNAIVRYTSTYYLGMVPSVTELDLNIGKTFKGWHIALIGQNLIESHHKESVLGTTSTQVERGGYIKVTREF